MNYKQFFILLTILVPGQSVIQAYNPTAIAGSRIFNSIKYTAPAKNSSTKTVVAKDKNRKEESILVKNLKFARRGFLAICATLTMF